MDVKTLCLAALSRRDATGYEIRKLFSEGPFAYFQTASLGAIYPALTRAAAEGLVTVTEEAQDGRPDKKIYCLTSAGHAALSEACKNEPAEDHYRSDTLFLIYFAQLQSPDKIARLIDQHIADYESKCACLEAQPDTCFDEPGKRFVRGLGSALYGAAAEYLRANRGSLLAELQAETRDAAE